MNKEFIPYEQALELKELGFDERCFFIYTRDGSGLNRLDEPQNSKELYERTIQPNTYVVAPLYQQAFRWFREKYMLHSWIEYYEINNYRVICNKKYLDSNCLTYEEAELACLKKLIEIAKNHLHQDFLNQDKEL